MTSNEIIFENPQATLIRNGGLFGLENNSTSSISKHPKDALKILYSTYKTIKQLIQEKGPIKINFTINFLIDTEESEHQKNILVELVILLHHLKIIISYLLNKNGNTIHF